MPQPVDVGSILGGRYKVTGHVTTSADDDLVLDGVDQVLNRDVSILVAGQDNADQVATSAREIATGERPGNVQVLDLGLADNRTYLITNQTSAADLLDLVVAANPPYVEPFYTDTLGTEIFGQPRSTEPEGYDDRYEQASYEDVQPQSPPPARGPGTPRGSAVPPPPSVPPKSAGQQGDPNRDAGATGAAAGGAQQGPTRSPQQHEPKVTLWGTDDYARHDEETDDRRGAAAGAGAGAAAGAGAGAAAGASPADAESGRPASRFPAAARGAGAAYAAPEDEEDPQKNRRVRRWVVGAVLAVLLIAAVVLAVGQLGSMFQPTASDNPGQEQNAPANPGQQTEGEATSEPEESDSPSPSPSPTEEQGVEPAAASVTRLVPDSPDLDAGNDGDLPLTIDGNPATSWNSLLYANDTFGGFASNMALAVELEEASDVTEVQLQQLNGSGGSFQILLNDSPSLDGASQVAQGSFTAPSITVPIPEQEGAPRTAQYVIINFTELPQLANSSGPYPWGIKLAEINIS